MSFFLSNFLQATLADEFLEDLGELDGSDDEELVDEEEEYKRKR